MPERIKLPNGVELYEPEDFSYVRDRIYDKAKTQLQSAFPMSYNGVRMEVHDLDYSDPPEFDLERQKEALLKDEFLARRLRGTVRLVDEKTNQPLDEKSLTLMRVPFLNERGTFTHGGSEYGHSRQARLLPGAYSRRQNSGDLETQFNVKSGTGAAFRVGFEPRSAQYRLRVRGSNLHLYSLLKDLGVPDPDLEKRWGPEVLAANAKKYDSRVLSKAYQHLVPKRDQKPDAQTPDKADAVRNALHMSMVHREAVERTLPGILGEKQADAWREKVAATRYEMDAVDFAPDLDGETALDSCATFYKFASVEDFSPDLDPDEMRESYNAIYAKVGPRLASMEKWPAHWFHPGDNQLGWIDWYMKYREGNRSDEDERQIRRWKAFKARHGTAFASSPTPRRAFALRNWAIDPLKLIDDPDKRAAFEKEMDAYKETLTAKHEKKADAPESFAASVIEHIDRPLRPEPSWVAGLRRSFQ